MKKNKEIISPVGLKGNAINERIIELMGVKPINENKSTSVIELTKMGPDGNVYAIVRENHGYFIKTTGKKTNIVSEDLEYVGGYMNRETYPSYAKAIKHLNLKFNSLNEAYNKTDKINVFEDDNLISEDVAGFANHPKGGGFSGEGNLEGNTPLTTEEEMCDEELTEEEKAVDDMNGDKAPENPEKPEDQPGYITEKKLSMIRAIEQMDSIIEGLSGKPVKKKVYTIK